MTVDITENGAESPVDEQTVPGRGIGAEESQNGSESQSGSREDPGDRQSEEGRKPSREQRYRMERNQAREHITALQTRELERLAGEHLAQPGDLLELGGVTLSDLLTEAGYIDSGAVAEAAAALIASRPGVAKNPKFPAVDPSQGLGGHGGPSQPSFSDLFR